MKETLTRKSPLSERLRAKRKPRSAGLSSEDRGGYYGQLIREIGLEEKEVFITSPVKYLPRRGTPSNADIVHGRTHLLRQLAVIDPKIIVLLGRVATLAVLDREVAVSQEHGKMIKKGDKTYLITFHPAAALRFPKIRKEFYDDFEKLKGLTGEGAALRMDGRSGNCSAVQAQSTEGGAA